MGVWVYVVAYLVAFVVIQLVVYRYLRGRNGDAGVALASGPNADRAARGDAEASDHGDRFDHLDRGSRAAAAAASDRRCPACGTANDPEGPYTFCRNCATRLPG